MFYCGKCATQAASQGFTVKHISLHVSNAQSKTKVLPNYPQYNGQPRYNQVLDLLKKVVDLEEESRKFDSQRVAEHYQTQEDQLNNFYE